MGREISLPIAACKEDEKNSSILTKNIFHNYLFTHYYKNVINKFMCTFVH
jgi:hypothetical protein